MLLNPPEVDTSWKVQPFTLSNPDGKVYTLADFQGNKGLLIVFICNHCPYVQAIIKRLVSDVKILQSEGIDVVAINSNDYRYVPEDSPPMMRKFAVSHGFTFPYLIDEDQSVAKSYGAVCTPDFFGFNRDGELQYRGRLDDAKMGDPARRKTELLDAMRQISETGRGPVSQFSSIGCSIKWT